MCIYYYLRNRFFFFKKEEKERHQSRAELPFQVDQLAALQFPPFSVYYTWASGRQISRKFLPWLICASMSVPQVTESNREGRLLGGVNSQKHEAEGAFYCGKKLLRNTKKMLRYITV